MNEFKYQNINHEKNFMIYDEQILIVFKQKLIKRFDSQ